ncbi:tetraacyldisaccharide 4'-kinase [Lacihabitans sp. CS3-21]|uniref:tetraacyldisaccharide 4'-kinase n=1 Tax=Lacihabitans sp. CS3-21 TaxID=2487332 RepID=UPI0020CCA5A2|nr:tetraacyldisaccharide 4'-kinase [Lacihabitans sp. CS3-21]
MIQFLKYLLFPFSLIYKGITSLRNLLFELKVLRTFEPNIATIGVGNLTVGGTGKTPIIDYLISIFPKNKIGIISRGYGRKTQGFLQINSKSTSKDVGDEPFMLYSKNIDTSFFVSEDRVEGFKKALLIQPNLDIILFDDVFQHRYLKPKINILLSDYSRPFFEDFLLPTGLLRESKSGAKRADIIIVTKCPSHISEIERRLLTDKIKKFTKKDTPIYFAVFQSLPPSNIENAILTKNSKIVLISGLANNLGFKAGIEQNFEIDKHFKYKDHHEFTKEEITEILSLFPKSNFVCTAKDFVKIKPLLYPEFLPSFYISEQKISIINEIELKKEIFEQLGFIN